jgi:hypothetical protein
LRKKRIILGFLDRITGLSGLTGFLKSKNPVKSCGSIEIIGKVGDDLNLYIL